jgi:hypothetical protein
MIAATWPTWHTGGSEKAAGSALAARLEASETRDPTIGRVREGTRAFRGACHRAALRADPVAQRGLSLAADR